MIIKLNYWKRAVSRAKKARLLAKTRRERVDAINWFNHAVAELNECQALIVARNNRIDRLIEDMDELKARIAALEVCIKS